MRKDNPKTKFNNHPASSNYKKHDLEINQLYKISFSLFTDSLQSLAWNLVTGKSIETKHQEKDKYMYRYDNQRMANETVDKLDHNVIM